MRKIWNWTLLAGLAVALALCAAPISQAQQPAPPNAAEQPAPPITAQQPAPPNAAQQPAGAPEEEHNHDHGFQSDTDARRNLAGPLAMIVAGTLYFGYARWTTNRRRTAARAAQ